jgi:hypothetical protein
LRSILEVIVDGASGAKTTSSRKIDDKDLATKCGRNKAGDISTIT